METYLINMIQNNNKKQQQHNTEIHADLLFQRNIKLIAVGLQTFSGNTAKILIKRLNFH
jgi:transcriptional accessory protein Tex/SPT6